MKKISYFFIVFVLIVGCVKGQNKENLNNLRDSLDKMVLEGTLREGQVHRPERVNQEPVRVTRILVISKSIFLFGEMRMLLMM